jgi:hypothetical protein
MEKTNTNIGCEVEQELVLLIGRNKTDEKKFSSSVLIEKGSKELLGFYTYRGHLYILDCTGMDVCFGEYKDEDKKIIYDVIKQNKYS